MSRKSVTHVTFNVHFDIPPGSNITEAREFIKAALFYRANNIDGAWSGLTEVPVTVQLVKKEVTYA